MADRTLVHEQPFTGCLISLPPGKRRGESQKCEKNCGRYAFHLSRKFLFDIENGTMIRCLAAWKTCTQDLLVWDSRKAVTRQAAKF
jgi:hypothetical protein